MPRAGLTVDPRVQTIRYEPIPLTTRRKPGRKKKLFSPSWDPKSGHMGYFVGYCIHGEEVIWEWATIADMKVKIHQSQKSMRVRALKWALHRLEAP